jgi:hypothetical protein
MCRDALRPKPKGRAATQDGQALSDLASAVTVISTM